VRNLLNEIRKIMTHGSLFSGIGGFDLVAEQMGWANIFQVEKDDFCNIILDIKHEHTIKFKDIKTVDLSQFGGKIDVLSGGFPCQPFSQAGKRRGTDDDRYLWPAMLRCIRDVQPTWVVAENVYGLLTMQQGVVFEQVCVDLENEGYEVQPFIIPAASVDAPHLRYRVFFVANSPNARVENMQLQRQNGIFECEFSADSAGEGLQRAMSRAAEMFTESFQNFPTQSPVLSGDDGFSAELLRCRIREDSMGLLSEEEIDEIISKAVGKLRKEAIKAAGNAVVSQVVYRIFKNIERVENEIK
jgi:DNA (cytosine-5)-methyltransferase 1